MKEYPSTESLLQKLEADSVTNREKAELLTQIIDIESEKPKEEADVDLIEACFAYLETILHEEAEIAERQKQLPGQLQLIQQKAAERTASRKNPRKPARRKRIIGILAAVFVTILLVATSLTVIARVNGYESMGEWVSMHLKELLQLEPGKKHEMDGFTVVHGTDNKTYSSVEAWMQEESWDVLYPSDLPDNVRVDRVSLVSRSEDEILIAWVFNTPDVQFCVQNFDLAKLEPVDTVEIVEINGYRFGILAQPEGAYQATGVIEDFAYFMKCTNYEDLLFLLHHLKGMETSNEG